MRIRRLIVAFLCFLLLYIGAGLTLNFWQLADRRADAVRTRSQIEANYNRLETLVEAPSGQKDLLKYCQAVARRAGLSLTLGEFVEAELRTSFDNTFVPPGSSQISPARRLLADALAQQGLDFEVTAEGLVVRSGYSPEMEVEVYPLQVGDGFAKEGQVDALVQMLTGRFDLVDARWYGAAQVNSQTGRLHVVPGAFVIVTTRAEHYEIGRMLAALESLNEQPLSDIAVQLHSRGVFRDKVLDAALESEVSIDCRGQPLDEVLQTWSRDYRVPIVVNRAMLEEASLSPTMPISAKLRRLSLRSALEFVLSEVELTFLVEDGAIQVTTPSDSCGPEYFDLRAYPVQGLTGNGKADSLAELIDVVTSSVDPMSWETVGGRSTIMAAPGSQHLLVSAPVGTHESVDRLLQGLRRAMQNDAALVITAELVTPLEQRVVEALDHPWTSTTAEQPLDDVLASIGDTFQISALANHRGLVEAAADPNQKVKLIAGTMPLREHLRRMLSPLELTYHVRNEALIVTNPDVASSPEQFTRRLYDVRLLCDNEFGALSEDELTDVVMHFIGDDGWDEVGGYGSIRYFRGCMVVFQLPHFHKRLEALLTVLRQHCLQPFPAPAIDDRPLVVPVERFVTNEQIAQALQQRVTISFNGETLQQALEQVCRDQRITLDLPAFGEIEHFGAARTANLAEPVAIDVTEMTVSGVFDRLLLRHGLAYDIADGVLRIDDFHRLFSHSPSDLGMTSPSETVRLYRMTAIQGSHSGLADQPAALIDKIQQRIASEEWSEHNAPATVRPIGHEWLLVRGPTMIQDEIDDLLVERRTGTKPLRAIERAELTDEELPLGFFTNFGGRLRRPPHE